MIIKGEEKDRNRWKLRIVEEVMPGKGGAVRPAGTPERRAQGGPRPPCPFSRGQGGGQKCPFIKYTL